MSQEYAGRDFGIVLSYPRIHTFGVTSEKDVDSVPQKQGMIKKKQVWC